MPFTLPGADISLFKTPGTANGKFDLQWDTATQNPVYVDDQSHAVLSLIYEHRGEYWADPTGARGSYVWTIKDDRKNTPSQLAGYIKDALQPLVDQGKIKDVKVDASRAFPGRVNFNVTYSLPNGQTVSVRPNLSY